MSRPFFSTCIVLFAWLSLAYSAPPSSAHRRRQVSEPDIPQLSRSSYNNPKSREWAELADYFTTPSHHYHDAHSASPFALLQQITNEIVHLLIQPTKYLFSTSHLFTPQHDETTPTILSSSLRSPLPCTSCPSPSRVGVASFHQSPTNIVKGQISPCSPSPIVYVQPVYTSLSSSSTLDIMIRCENCTSFTNISLALTPGTAQEGIHYFPLNSSWLIFPRPDSNVTAILSVPLIPSVYSLPNNDSFALHSFSATITALNNANSYVPIVFGSPYSIPIPPPPPPSQYDNDPDYVGDGTDYANAMEQHNNNNNNNQNNNHDNPPDSLVVNCTLRDYVDIATSNLVINPVLPSVGFSTSGSYLVNDVDSAVVIEVDCLNCNNHEALLVSAVVTTQDMNAQAGIDYISTTAKVVYHDRHYNYSNSEVQYIQGGGTIFPEHNDSNRRKRMRFIAIPILPHRSLRISRSFILTLSNLTAYILNENDTHASPQEIGAYYTNARAYVTISPTKYCGPGALLTATRTVYECPQLNQTLSIAQYNQQVDSSLTKVVNASTNRTCSNVWSYFEKSIYHANYSMINTTLDTSDIALQYHIDVNRLSSFCAFVDDQYLHPSSSPSSIWPQPDPSTLSELYAYCGSLYACAPNCTYTPESLTFCACPYDRYGVNCEQYTSTNCSLSLVYPSRSSHCKDVAIDSHSTSSNLVIKTYSDLDTDRWEPLLDGEPPCFSTRDLFNQNTNNHSSGDTNTTVTNQRFARFDFAMDCFFLNPQEVVEGPGTPAIATQLKQGGYQWNQQYNFTYTLNRNDSDGNKVLFLSNNVTMLLETRIINFNRLSDRLHSLSTSISPSSLSSPYQNPVSFYIDINSLYGDYIVGGRIHIETSITDRTEMNGIIENPLHKTVVEVDGWSDWVPYDERTWLMPLVITFTVLGIILFVILFLKYRLWRAKKDEEFYAKARNES